jgi:general secretion pathway protein G
MVAMTSHFAMSQRPRTNRQRRDRRGSRGFTLIEIMVVLTIIAILVGMAAVRYDRSMVNAREAVLKQDLQALRGAIQQFTLDKQRAPQTLEELSSAGYLREVPIDPITRSKDWQLQFEDVALSPDQTGTGITDIHSKSEAVSPNDGGAYNTW